jgi:alanyl-tRNA synthetase
MTEHLYYHDSFLYEFDASVVGMASADSRPAVVLDRTAFYPTSGGQVFDTGWIIADGEKLRVADVSESDGGDILHFLESPAEIEAGSRIRGIIDADRRRDHMQQHSGQHVLSAAFVRALNMPTVSFHMGTDACSIDLDTKSLTAKQAELAETLANDVVTENREVNIRFVSSTEAKGLGLRKLPPAERDQLRLIDIHDFDLTACGGTHVSATGQIGAILLRKIEKVRQGWRVEFVCGKRAVSTARRDYAALAESAGLLSAHVWDVPQQVRKMQEESRALKKSAEQVLGELADVYAGRMLAETVESKGRRVVVRVFPDRDLGFIKLLAQRLIRQSSNVVALLAAGGDSPAVVFAQSAGQPFDMGSLMKATLGKLGGRGGGSKDMAQGGIAQLDGIEAEMGQIAARLGKDQKR